MLSCLVPPSLVPLQGRGLVPLHPRLCPLLAALPDAMLILLSLGFIAAIVFLGGLARSLAWDGPCFQLEAEGCDAATLDATTLAAPRSLFDTPELRRLLRLMRELLRCWVRSCLSFS